ncbi:hypothetical protein [Clostridium sp. C8-1-8]|uniref:hypothetical protein n=1 Tax=Clostridium sp. C8-1-8 TaxID=2698831 RepID=UPI001368BBF7|nr:hypothetical protein [Clostridium sp. C8-1-8]
MDKQLFDKCTKLDLNAVKKAEYIQEICSFKREQIKEVMSQVKRHVCYTYNNNKLNKGLWVLFGKPIIEGVDNEEWICLEVGSSEDIIKELVGDLNLMISKSDLVEKHSEFFTSVFEFNTYMDRTSVKYRKIYEMCKEFSVFEINIEKYIVNEEISNYDVVNYAEVKYASDYKALFWNPAPAFKGNQEKEILKAYLEKKK